MEMAGREWLWTSDLIAHQTPIDGVSYVATAPSGGGARARVGAARHRAGWPGCGAPVAARGGGGEEPRLPHPRSDRAEVRMQAVHGHGNRARRCGRGECETRGVVRHGERHALRA